MRTIPCQQCGGVMVKRVESSGNALGCAFALLFLAIGLILTAYGVACIGIPMMIAALFIEGKRQNVWRCRSCRTIVNRGSTTSPVAVAAGVVLMAIVAVVVLQDRLQKAPSPGGNTKTGEPIDSVSDTSTVSEATEPTKGSGSREVESTTEQSGNETPDDVIPNVVPDEQREIDERRQYEAERAELLAKERKRHDTRRALYETERKTYHRSNGHDWDTVNCLTAEEMIVWDRENPRP